MRYVVIDIETSGLDPAANDVLSIGAIVEDTEKQLPYELLPKFNAAILHRQVTGSIEALSINRNLIDNVSSFLKLSKEDREAYDKEALSKPGSMRFFDKEDIVKYFFYWLHDSGFPINSSGNMVTSVDNKIYPTLPSSSPTVITAAGKNFGTFDKLFLENLPRWKQLIKVHQRIIDPAVLYVDWSNDEVLPNLAECKRRAKLDERVSHNALEDAWDTLQIIRNAYR